MQEVSTTGAWKAKIPNNSTKGGLSDCILWDCRQVYAKFDKKKHDKSKYDWTRLESAGPH